MSDKKTNVMRILDSNKIKYDIYKFDITDEHIDAVNVAKLINEDVKYVYKTLVLKGVDNNYYVCVVNAVDELDLKKTAKELGIKNISMINVNDINKITGYIRGGCSPIGMKKQFTTVIDESAKNIDYIVVSAGQRGIQVKLKLDDLLKITKSSVKDIVKGV